MLVCDCNDVNYEDIKKAVAEFGTDLETLKDETSAGTACECCLEEGCDRVELALPLAIEKAKEELGI
ncbi:MAG: bacterioferritin-associated ferredoxin [Arcobacteraceae bacterium]|jgi:bacterioferritin-associated ferredoxin